MLALITNRKSLMSFRLVQERRPVAEFMHQSIVFGSTCTMSSWKKFTFAISSPDEFLVNCQLSGGRATTLLFFSRSKLSRRFVSERELKFMFAICHRPSVCRLSVVCNVRVPYSDDWNFRQCFYAIWYLGHPWPFGKNFTEIVLGEPLRRGS